MYTVPDYSRRETPESAFDGRSRRTEFRAGCFLFFNVDSQCGMLGRMQEMDKDPDKHREADCNSFASRTGCKHCLIVVEI